jgi:signal transduction histidine kinase
LPGYLRDLAEAMGENQLNLQGEVKSLVKQIDHVKAIVALQQDYAKSSSFKENLDPVETMEDAVQINRVAYERHGIQIVREYDSPPPAFADRHKVLQILINVLSNAKYALAQAPADARRVVLRVCAAGEDRVRLEVSDTGAGIALENMERIFTLGFTTKADGHGFGLHSGANAAKEMGGRLFVQSEGLGRGATFVLELPAAPKAAGKTRPEVETV